MAEDPKFEVPSLVRSRMATQQGSAMHPDADLLAAFTEQRLSGAERSNVLEHLGVCPECREVVSLAAPEVAEESKAIAPVPWRLFGLGFPQWGALGLSAAAVVAFFVMLKTGPVAQSPANPTVAKVEQPVAPPPAPQKEAQIEVQPPSASARKKQRNALASPPADKKRDDAQEFSYQKNKPVVADEMHAMDALSAKKPEPKVSSATETVEVESGAPPTAAVQSKPMPSAAAEPVTVQAQNSEVQTMAAPTAQAKSQPQEERAGAQAGMHDYAVMNRSAAKIAPSNIVARPDGTKFRYQNAALWRADAKGQWQRVTGAWSGAITRLAFSSNEKGELTTSTGETWITTDGGEHWQKK